MDIKPIRIALLISLAVTTTPSYSQPHVGCTDNNVACDKAVEEGISAKSLASTDEAWMSGKLKEIKTWLNQEQENSSESQASSVKPDQSSRSQPLPIRSRQSQDPELIHVEALSKAGNHRGAMSAVNSYLAKQPNSIEGQLTKSLVLSNMGKNKEAEALLKTSLKSHPNSPELYNNLAVLYAEQGQNSEAIEVLLKAFNTHPAYAQIHKNLRELYATVASQAYNRALNIKEKNNNPKLGMLHSTTVHPSQPVKSGTIEHTTPTQHVSLSQAAQRASQTVAERSKPTIVEAAKPSVKTTATPNSVPQKKVTEAQKVREAIASVRRWASAWEQQNVPAYIDAYTHTYSPKPSVSHSAWRAQRELRLKKPTYIKITLSNISTRLTGQSTAIVTFSQSYESNTYSDITRKQITLTKTGTDWKISKEAAL